MIASLKGLWRRYRVHRQRKSTLSLGLNIRSAIWIIRQLIGGAQRAGRNADQRRSCPQCAGRNTGQHRCEAARSRISCARARKIPPSYWAIWKMRGSLEEWCCREGLNFRPRPYQGRALPLSYGSARRGGQGAAPGKRRGQCHFGPAKARPGKTRNFPSLSSIFHSSAIVRSCPAGNQRPRKRGHRAPIRSGEKDHDHRHAGLVAAFPEPAAPPPGYPRLSAPDGCAGGRAPLRLGGGAAHRVAVDPGSAVG